MVTAELPLPAMGRRPSDAKPDKVELDTDIVRVPVKMTRAQRELLHEVTMFWLRGAAEAIAGEWLIERLTAERAKGREGAVAAYVASHPDQAKKFGIAEPPAKSKPRPAK